MEVDTGEAFSETPMESTETSEPTADSTPAPDWDGSLDSLVSQAWVPDSAREHLSRHLEDYESTRTRADFLHRLFEADDRTAEMAKELDTLRQAMSAREQELNDWRTRASTYEEQIREVEEDREYDRLKSQYPDIFEDCHADEKNPENFKGAWPMFLDLTVRGYDEETAAKLARALLPATSTTTPSAPPVAEQRREVALPPSIKAASRGGNNPSSTINAAEANESFDQRVRRMMAEARDRGE